MGFANSLYICRFFVDDIPIRRYERKLEATFPERPMWVYGSIWDASSWATDDGRYRADYRYQPFVAHYTRFGIGGCSAFAPGSCRPVPASPSGSGLSPQQWAAMRWAQTNHMVYYYCQDYKRDHSLTPECWDFRWRNFYKNAIVGFEGALHSIISMWNWVWIFY